MSLILLTFLIVGLCNGQTIVNLTASNSTGDYYITDSVNKFANSEIHCGSDIACYIECVTKNSCSKLTVYCGNSPICDIVCGNDYACRWGLHVYISPNATTISCKGWGSCKEIIWLYTNYTYHPSSTTFVDYHEDSYCNDIAIKDTITEEDNYDELTVDRFKIYCEYCSWESYSASNLLTIPTIVNETGEYYLDSGSLVDIQCSTDKLCYIDCNDRSCSRSNMDCGPSQECFILCGKHNGCGSNDVSATGQNQFTYLCDANAVDCTDWGSFNLTNIDTVNITCQTTNGCSLNDWYITSVPDLNVQCDFYWVTLLAVITQYPTTSEPTTSEPTTNPTTARPTENPTTANPTASTGSPTTIQPTMEVPIHSNGGHRLLGWFWVVLVIGVIDIVQIM